VADPNDHKRMTATVVIDPRNPCPTEPTTRLVLRDRKGVEYDAIVDHESFTTIAITLVGGIFRRGDAVEAEYGGAAIPAVVRNADFTAGGKWKLLLGWGT
jgi:hypothetical protein